MRIKIRLKLIVDILLFLAGLVCIITGITLLILPSGPGTKAGLAQASSSTLDITTRSGLRLWHDWSSIIIIALILFHLMLNWRTIVCYVRNAFKPAARKL
jgi:hypothetical protein